MNDLIELPRRESGSDALQPTAEELRTHYRGKISDEYLIYVAAAESLGWPIKSFEEWFNAHSNP